MACQAFVVTGPRGDADVFMMTTCLSGANGFATNPKCMASRIIIIMQLDVKFDASWFHGESLFSGMVRILLVIPIQTTFRSQVPDSGTLISRRRE